MPGKAIRVRGIVQGVGFRPTVWRLARQHQLRGAVWNDAQGVLIHVWGKTADLNQFIAQLTCQAPALARIDALETDALEHPCVHSGFQILSSRKEGFAQTAIAADAATCAECLAEITDPRNRRYRYAFTNCIQCGPRLSIIQGIPYDRDHTSMAEFVMCRQCQAEFDDPSNRRFHAQANACPACGPQLWLEDTDGAALQTADVITTAAELLKQGQIIAIKGIGGFHLACMATDETTVSRLRQRKQRYHKPFALMGRDVTMVRRYVQIDDMQRTTMEDKSAAIIIVNAQGEPVAESVAPDDEKLGFMLPYTPLHHCLLQELSEPIVLTSGNISHEPQCIDNDAARQQLSGLCDYFLLHNREIINRLDDSVIRVMDAQPRILRRARGFSTEAIKLSAGFEQAPAILAMGGELKNTFCLLNDGQAIVSQHMGDLENARVQLDYRHNLKLYQQLYEFQADCIAVDLHPDYLSTQLGQELALQQSLPVQPVQHHHAHIAACMAEYGLAIDSPPVLAVVFDGLGMGTARQLWGGEFMLADYTSFIRLAHFQAIPMPGGVRAIQEPWRNAYAQLTYYFDWLQLRQRYADLDIIRFLELKPLKNLETMMARQFNTPVSSSCGRWFDAFAAVLGLCTEQVSYEGQAAIELEMLATLANRDEHTQGYSFQLNRSKQSIVLNWRPFWEEVLSDLQRGVVKPAIAFRIHLGLAQATVAVVMELSKQQQTDTVVLSGGVFQNRLLLEMISNSLRKFDKTVLAPRKFPANDGGLSLGQAVIAAAKNR